MRSLACISILLLVVCSVLLAASCSRRFVYEQASVNVKSQDAININTASVDQLETLPHIGRRTAESIVEFRNVNGAFRRPEHLMQIRGISEERFREIRQYIRTE